MCRDLLARQDRPVHSLPIVPGGALNGEPSGHSYCNRYPSCDAREKSKSVHGSDWGRSSWVQKNGDVGVRGDLFGTFLIY